MVKYITYNGKEYPIRVSYYALTVLKEKSGKKLEELTENDLGVYAPFLFAALQAGSWITNEELTLKEEDMIKVLDQCFFDFIALIPEFFAKSDIRKLGKGKVDEKK